MEQIENWLPRISWTDLAIGLAVGAAVLGALILLAFFLRPRGGDDDGGRRGREQDAQRRLFCEDAKVLADLAIQRHMSDVAFLKRFRSPPVMTPYSLISAKNSATAWHNLARITAIRIWPSLAGKNAKGWNGNGGTVDPVSTLRPGSNRHGLR